MTSPPTGYPGEGSASLSVITWSPRSVPLEPVAVVARGEVARGLAQRLLQELDGERNEAPPTLSGAVSGDILILIGDSEHLPWMDGVHYLGRDISAPSLLLPTNLLPSVALPLLEKAVHREFPSLASPITILPFWPEDSGITLVISAASALPLNPERIRLWLNNEH